MSGIQPFSPGATGTINAGTVAGNRLAFPGNGTTLRVYNSGSVLVFVKAGDSTVEATTNDWWVAPGEQMNFCIPNSATHVAASTGQVTTATTYLARGDGGV